MIDDLDEEEDNSSDHSDSVESNLDNDEVEVSHQEAMPASDHVLWSNFVFLFLR